MKDSGEACAFQCLLLCDSIYTSLRLTNECRTISTVPILHPRPVSSSWRLYTIRWSPSQHGLDWLQPHSFIQLLTLVLGCSSLPKGHLGSVQQHLLQMVRADHPHVHRHLPFQVTRCAAAAAWCQSCEFRSSCLLPPSSAASTLVFFVDEMHTARPLHTRKPKSILRTFLTNPQTVHLQT